MMGLFDFFKSKETQAQKAWRASAKQGNKMNKKAGHKLKGQKYKGTGVPKKKWYEW